MHYDRRSAREAGETIFAGIVCRKHDSHRYVVVDGHMELWRTDRYTKSGGCVLCMRARAAQQKADQRAKRKAVRRGR